MLIALWGSHDFEAFKFLNLVGIVDHGKFSGSLKYISSIYFAHFLFRCLISIFGNAELDLMF